MKKEEKEGEAREGLRLGRSPKGFGMGRPGKGAVMRIFHYERRPTRL